MIVGLDVGNSAIKSAEFLDDDIGEVTFWHSFAELKKQYPQAKFFVCSVGMAAKAILRELPGSRFFTTQTPTPLLLNYQTPETLGPDRLAAGVGGWVEFPNKNLLIIDGGTCITYDVVTNEGVFEGGIISPGISLRLKSMHTFTDALPDLSPTKNYPYIGKTTAECMQAGAQQGLVYEIEGFLNFFNKKYEDLQVIVTGGFVPSFESSTKAPIFASSKIVLMGLHAIWKMNEGI